MPELIAVFLFDEDELTQVKAPNAVVSVVPRVGETVYVRDNKANIVKGTVLNVIHELWRGQDKDGEVRITLMVKLDRTGIL